MIVSHFNELPSQWWRWPNFTPGELSCRCCGEFYWDETAIDTLQRARDLIQRPLIISSAHRCAIHNARVGGAPRSQHKRIAFDIQVGGMNRQSLRAALIDAGFPSFGYYRTFIHADLREGRIWYGHGARELWKL